jgi:hypothetical protein
MSAALTKLEEWQARRNGTAPQPAPGMEGETPSVPGSPSGNRGRRGTTNDRPRGNPSKKDRYATVMLTPDAAADIARLCAMLRDAIAASPHTVTEVTRVSGFSRLTQYVALDITKVRRMRISTLQRIATAADMPSNVVDAIIASCPNAIAPEEDAK